jgi:hypothetical protein
MYKLLSTILTLTIVFAAFSQRDLTPSRKRDAFGSRDFNNYRPYGLQISAGPTYNLTNSGSVLTQPSLSDGGQRYRYELSDKGRLGAFIELGMAHFPMTPRKTRLWSYFDWGLGLQMYSGTEDIRIDYLTSTNEVLKSENSKARWSNTMATARFTAHRNMYLGKKYFIDHALGINLDYRIATNTVPHTFDTQTFQNGSPAEQVYSGEIAAQIHYGLGFGVKLRRNLFLIPSVELPVFGIAEWNKGNPSTLWFSSYYWPIKARVKLIWLFKQKSKPGDCNTGTPEDQKRAKEYRQNR